MAVGTVVGMPPDGSIYARVKDEYNNVYTVHASELPEDAELGDQAAYKVAIWDNPSGNTTTLRKR